MHIWAGLEIMPSTCTQLFYFATLHGNILPRPYMHTYFLIELSSLDPKLTETIRKLLCICRHGQKMCCKDRIFKKCTLTKPGQPRPRPHSTNILISQDFFQRTNNNSINKVKKSVKIPKNCCSMTDV